MLVVEHGRSTEEDGHDPKERSSNNEVYSEVACALDAPMIAGAAANLQGIALNRFGAPLPPSQITALLVETGSPQLGNTAEHIGPRPDLFGAITQLLGGNLSGD